MHRVDVAMNGNGKDKEVKKVDKREKKEGGILLWEWGRKQWTGGTAEHGETLRGWY